MEFQQITPGRPRSAAAGSGQGPARNHAPPAGSDLHKMFPPRRFHQTLQRNPANACQ
ncbi:hypothetical protein [Lysobacter gummosus]|uniref:hypothetical protein n=1 Tax=Lysobacter gummosus TaxID=262324 RepID=UPI00362D16C5